MVSSAQNAEKQRPQLHGLHTLGVVVAQWFMTLGPLKLFHNSITKNMFLEVMCETAKR